MKKLIMAILAIVMMAAFAISAQAGMEPDIRYAMRDLKMYEEKSTSSGVWREFSKGDEILIEGVRVPPDRDHRGGRRDRVQEPR